MEQIMVDGVIVNISTTEQEKINSKITELESEKALREIESIKEQILNSDFNYDNRQFNLLRWRNALAIISTVIANNQVKSYVVSDLNFQSFTIDKIKMLTIAEKMGDLYSRTSLAVQFDHEEILAGNFTNANVKAILNEAPFDFN